MSEVPQAMLGDALAQSGFSVKSDNCDESCTATVAGSTSLALAAATDVIATPCAAGAALRLRLLRTSFQAIVTAAPRIADAAGSREQRITCDPHNVTWAANGSSIDVLRVRIRPPGVVAHDPDAHSVTRFATDVATKFNGLAETVLRQRVAAALRLEPQPDGAFVLRIAVTQASLSIAATLSEVAALAGPIGDCLGSAVAWAVSDGPEVLAATERKVAAAVARTRAQIARADEAAAAAASWWGLLGLAGDGTADNATDDAEDEEEGEEGSDDVSSTDADPTKESFHFAINSDDDDDAVRRSS